MKFYVTDGIIKILDHVYSHSYMVPWVFLYCFALALHLSRIVLCYCNKHFVKIMIIDELVKI